MDPESKPKPEKQYLAILALTALGIVFGDIGTSPIYAFREALDTNGGLQVTPENIMGVLSLILWSLIIVISIKYFAKQESDYTFRFKGQIRKRIGGSLYI